MESHQHHSGQQVPAEKKMEDEMVKMDDTKMDHSKMHHDANPPMGMEGHDHHAMMINDFKRRFFITLIL
jgi:Cu2+-exporting ATPase